MKLIQLRSGENVMVDDEDYELLYNNCTWYAHKTYSAGKLICTYARGRFNNKLLILMHRVILKLKVEDMVLVDHIDHNGLNNQKVNLRICTNQQNLFNARCMTKEYKGTHKPRGRNKWLASIRIDNKIIRLGHYAQEIDAALAYDEAARKYYGEFANCNFPPKS